MEVLLRKKAVSRDENLLFCFLKVQAPRWRVHTKLKEVNKTQQERSQDRQSGQLEKQPLTARTGSRAETSSVRRCTASYKEQQERWNVSTDMCDPSAGKYT